MPRPMPSSTKQAIRHICTVEVNVTSVLDIFCMSSESHTFGEIQQSFRKLSLLLHPDRVSRVDKTAGSRYMQLLSRAYEIAQFKARYAVHTNVAKSMSDAKVSWHTPFTRLPTSTEERVMQIEFLEAQKHEAEEEERQKRADLAKEKSRQAQQQEENRRQQREEAEHAARKRGTFTSGKRKYGSHRFDVTLTEVEDVSECYNRTNRETSKDIDTDTNDNFRENDPPEQAGQNVQAPHSDAESDELSSCELGDTPEVLDFDMSTYIPGFGTDTEFNFPNESEDESVSETATPATLSAVERRRHQRRKSKKKAMERARAALRAELEASQSWKPRRCVQIVPELHMQLSARWRCEQYIRAYTAHHGTQNGINIQQSAVRVVSKCRTKGCTATFLFDWQPKTGLWKLNRFLEHLNECSGQSTGSERPMGAAQFCTPAYTARQVARAIFDEAEICPGVSSRVIRALVKAKQLYGRQPPLTCSATPLCEGFDTVSHIAGDAGSVAMSGTTPTWWVGHVWYG